MKSKTTGGGSRFRIKSALAAVITLGCGSAAHAQDFETALKQTTVSGQLGVSDFTYINQAQHGNTANAFAVGGHLLIHTGALNGFSVGIGGYTAQSLGIYSDNPGHDSIELAGHTHSLQSFRDAYLQYENPWLEVRGGRQLINTPYANTDLYTFNPRAFMGVSGIINVIGHNDSNIDSAPFSLTTSTAELSVFGARMFNYSERFSSGFISGNRYQQNSNGFIVGGVRYQNVIAGTQYSVQGWYYDFYGLAQLVYGEAEFSTPLNGNLAVFGAAQIVAEGNSGSGASSYGNVDSHIYNGKLGLSVGKDSVALIGGYSPVSYNSFRHGGLIHPYNDLSVTLFTDTMQTGFEDLGPGYAVGVTGNVILLHDKLTISPSYVEYNVVYGFGGSTYDTSGAFGYPPGTPAHNQGLHVVDCNFNYSLSSMLKGLSLDWDTDAVIADAGHQGQVFYNPYFSSRAYIKYDF